jgi:hypothetical protein
MEKGNAVKGTSTLRGGSGSGSLGVGIGLGFARFCHLGPSIEICLTADGWSRFVKHVKSVFEFRAWSWESEC